MQEICRGAIIRFRYNYNRINPSTLFLLIKHVRDKRITCSVTLKHNTKDYCGKCISLKNARMPGISMKYLATLL